MPLPKLTLIDTLLNDPGSNVDFEDPEVLMAFANELYHLKAWVLFEGARHLCPVAEQHYMIALDTLGQAVAQFKLASIWQTQALIESRSK